VRVQLVALLAASALVLTGCGEEKKDEAPAKSEAAAAGSDAPASPPSSDGAPAEAPEVDGKAACKEFQDALTQSTGIQSKLATGGDISAELKATSDALEALKADAPDEVDAALNDMQEAFGLYAEVSEDPTSIDTKELSELATRLGKSGQVLSTYMTELCAS